MNKDEIEQRLARIDELVDVAVLPNKRMTIAGLGRMGCPIVDQLVRHGVGMGEQGRIRLIDGDIVELHNLLGTTYLAKHVGMSKVESMADIIRSIHG